MPGRSGDASVANPLPNGGHRPRPERRLDSRLRRQDGADGLGSGEGQNDRLARIPTSTYRLQFNRHFTFQDAQRLVPYLHALGITDCYSSPYLKAPPESTHGYDVCDHNALNPLIGTEEDLDQFVSVLRQHGMGQILDVVSNHMGIGSNSNLKWLDVLENGPSSPYANFFDIDWTPLNPGVELENKVLLPILGDPYGKVLENQELVLHYEDGSFFVSYNTNHLPINPRTYTEILRHAADRLEGPVPNGVHSRGGDMPSNSQTFERSNLRTTADEHLLELRSIITALSHLPPRTETDPERLAEAAREKEVNRRRLANLYQAAEPIRQALDQTVRLFNGVKGDPHSFDLLDALLNEQAYRLAYWRVAAEEINYRRFFDINGLAAIRMENEEVFYETHRLILRLLAEGKVTGLRIDHPDGLLDPAGYLRRLAYSPRHSNPRRNNEASLPLQEAGQGSDLDFTLHGKDTADAEPAGLPLYIVVEKILAKGESLPEDWPVHGTTGYDFLNMVNGLFVDRAARSVFDTIYTNFTGDRTSFSVLVKNSKKMIMLVSLAGEINLLAYQLKRISARNRWYRDLTLNSLTFALREVIASLPVYRTYVTAGGSSGVEERDRRYIEAAIAEARRDNPRTAASVFDFIADILLRRGWDDLTDEERAMRDSFVLKFQQTTGPVMAKGIEDTACYIYNRLTSLNEVGGDPSTFGIPVAEFHAHNRQRQQRYPHSLSSTSTHDTKRSEDVRARINVLSEIPKEWRAALVRWSKLNQHHKRLVDGKLAPDRNEEYLLYQTLLGAWPLSFTPKRGGEGSDDAEYAAFTERIKAYMLKAIKEAKVSTSWINPNQAHEEAVLSFVNAILDRRRQSHFLDDFAVLQRKVSYYGMFNSLSQTLLKIASPGVPDFYQGTEIWDFSLVDPDNRRPVDFAKREKMLQALQRRFDPPLPARERAGVRVDPPLPSMERQLVTLPALARQLVETKEDGQIKLYLIYRALTYRRQHCRLFAQGTYEPVQAQGNRMEHLVAFARVAGGHQVVAVVPRLLVGLTNGSMSPPLGEEVWQDTTLVLPDETVGRPYRNIFTEEIVYSVQGERYAVLPVGKVLANFPVALLERIVTSRRIEHEH